MFFNTTLTKAVTKDDQRLWLRTMDIVVLATDYLRSFPDKYHFSIECHSICRILAKEIPELSVIDGYFLGLDRKEGNSDFFIAQCDHSWLLTPDRAIIDPYPVGLISTNPLLISPKGTYLPWGQQLYLPDSSVTARVVGRNIHRKVRSISRFIEEARKAKLKKAA